MGLAGSCMYYTEREETRDALINLQKWELVCGLCSLRLWSRGVAGVVQMFAGGWGLERTPGIATDSTAYGATPQVQKVGGRGCVGDWGRFPSSLWPREPQVLMRSCSLHPQGRCRAAGAGRAALTLCPIHKPMSTQSVLRH
jgi:hypothetical protein